MHRAGQVGQRPQPLAGVVRGQLRAQPLAQQPGAAPLDGVAGERGLRRQDPVELGEGVAGQLRLGRQPVGARIGQPVLARAGAQGRRDDRVQVADGVDVPVGDLSGRGAHRSRSSRADIAGRSGSSPAARSMAYISAPSTMP